LNVYVTGPDGIDHGGLALDPNSSKASDLGIELFDPAHRNRPPLPKEKKPDEDSLGMGVEKKANPYVPPPLPEGGRE